jgi:putative ABC transport system permease protein
MAREPLAAALDLTGAFNDLQIGLAPGAGAAPVVAALDALLEPYGGRGAYARDDHISHSFLDSEVNETRVTSTLLPAIFLGVTAFLLHMVLSRLVGTQREQIAALKAFGYGSGTVGAHYLELALVPVLAGVALGVALGLWFAGGLADVYARFYRFPDARFEPSWGIVAAAVAVGAGAALVGALGAVRRAVTLPPAEAMRPESPARFRAGLLERWPALRALPPAARIVVRNLERRPARAAMTVAGLALAVGLLVVTRWVFDAVDYLERVQFHEVQREDIAVTFESPRPARAAHALARLPGVLRVEPFRAVPVRLSAGARSYRTVLLGFPADAELRRIVGEAMVPQPLPAGGALLTRELAARLGVRPGDVIRVEPLEGARRARDVEVAALADELLGLNAYMDAGALARLVGEQDAVSGAWLRVDPVRADSLYAALKRLPAVAGVGVREAAAESFRRTIAESFRISLLVTIVFAVVIAAGMVYNGARIALSERGRELASLRVLGFSRREVTAMLLGEQGLLTLLAIPAGYAVGMGFCMLLVSRFATELFRIPLVLRGETYLFALVVVAGAALLSAMAVGMRIARLDLVAVLKTRE